MATYFKIKHMKNLRKPIIFKKKRFIDKRGYFQEIFLQKEFKDKIKFTAVANSKKNVIRGMHFQIKNKQTKIISVKTPIDLVQSAI